MKTFRDSGALASGGAIGALLLLVLLPLRAQELGPAPVLTKGRPGPISARTKTADVSPIDTSDRTAVVAAFYTVYNASEGFADGWDGNTTACVVGVNSTNYDEATLRRVNYYRTMAGLPGTVALDESLSAKCIQAAMMMSAAGQLSHNPTNTWACYTADGAAAAAHSDLALGIEGPAAIDLYLDDPGTGNEFVGHRRWILYPPQASMGTGSVPLQSGKSPANALWVLASFGSRPASPPFIAWPSPGYFPYSILPKSSGRWSFSVRNASFTSASVAMMRGTNLLTTAVISSNASGYGDNTIVWTVIGVPTTAPATDTPYVVTVSDVLLNGVATNYTYTVTVIDPSVPNLKARLATNQVTIAWPVGPSGYLLQTGMISTNTTIWGNANYSSTPVGNEHQVTVSPEQGMLLFRLLK